MIEALVKTIRALRNDLRLPLRAKLERRQDHRGNLREDPGIHRVIQEGVAWIFRAQDRSVSQDGGVAHSFSLISNWSTSYPETTGYIIPTLLEEAKLQNNPGIRARAQRMVDWLVSIQLPDGAFQGGRIGRKPVVPVTFVTGQILLGLAHAVREFGDCYRRPMCAAADWLVANQDADGCWRKGRSPFALPGEVTYETHVAWGLLEAARMEPNPRYAEAALANVRWALRYQTENGWFQRCCLTDPEAPLTHTLGYALWGVIEAYRFTNDAALLRAARKTADGLLTALTPDGFLPGCLRQDWSAAADWACLTGSAQIACCWLLLYQSTGDDRYLQAAFAVNRYLRRTVYIEGSDEVRGAVKGSYPVDGGFHPYEFPNWACKFFIDANRLEKVVRDSQAKARTQLHVDVVPFIS